MALGAQPRAILKLVIGLIPAQRAMRVDPIVVLRHSLISHKRHMIVPFCGYNSIMEC